MSTPSLIVSLVFVALGFTNQAWGAADDGSLVRPSSFAPLVATCAPNVHLRTVSAIVRVESAANPFAININGAGKLSHQPSTAVEAVSLARRMLDEGYNIDVGLGQINSGNFGPLGYRLEDLFEPCANLQAMARILSECYRRAVSVFGEGQPALHAALSCYNTGDLRKGITNGYVRKVVSQVTLQVPELLPASDGSVPPTPTVHAASAGRKEDAARPDNLNGDPDAFGASADPDAFAQAPSAAVPRIKHQN